MGQQFDTEAMRRIIQTVIRSEQQLIANIARGELELSRLLTPFGIVRGKPTEEVSPAGTGAGTSGGNVFTLGQVVPLGENAPHPGDTIEVVNVPQKSYSTSDWVYAIYRYAIEVSGTIGTGTGTGHGFWEVLDIGSPAAARLVTFLVNETITAGTWDSETNELHPTTFKATPFIKEITGTDQTAKRVPGVVDSIRVACDFTVETLNGTSGEARIGKGLISDNDIWNHPPYSDLEPPVTVELISLDCNPVSWDGIGTGTGT